MRGKKEKPEAGRTAEGHLLVGMRFWDVVMRRGRKQKEGNQHSEFYTPILMFSLKSYDNPVLYLLPPFFRWGNWGSKKFHSQPKVTAGRRQSHNLKLHLVVAINKYGYLCRWFQPNWRVINANFHSCSSTAQTQKNRKTIINNKLVGKNWPQERGSCLQPLVRRLWDALQGREQAQYLQAQHSLQSLKLKTRLIHKLIDTWIRTTPAQTSLPGTERGWQVTESNRNSLWKQGPSPSLARHFHAHHWMGSSLKADPGSRDLKRWHQALISKKF